MNDYAPIMEQVARALLGDPNPGLSHPPRELRFGSHGSLAVDLRKGTFYDHERQEGGGVLDLICREKQFGDKKEARAWLVEKDYIFAEERPQPAPKARIVATYDYVDEDGVLLFQVVRFAPRKFLQRRPGNNGEWIWKLGDTRRVPYRLPELLEAIAAEHIVFFVEGEKDVERVVGLGLPATCNPGGAGKWRDELTPHFKDARLVILRDNDEIGRTHGKLVAKELRGTAAEIRILDLPELPAKGDVSDWLDAGHTVEELWQLVDSKAVEPDEAPRPTSEDTGEAAAPEEPEAPVEPDEAADEAPKAPPNGKSKAGRAAQQTCSYRTLVELEIMSFDPLKWIVPFYFPEGVTLLAGKPKVGKSWLVLAIGIAVAKGQMVLGQECAKRGVVYYALEDSNRRLRNRSSVILRGQPGWPDNLYTSLAMPNLDQGGIEHVRSFLTLHREIGVVFIDTLARFRGRKLKNEGDYEADSRTMAALLDLSHEMHVSIIVVHHVRKAESGDLFDTISGTLGLNGGADTLAILTRPADGEGLRLAIRGRDVEEEDKAVDFDGETGIWTVTGDYEPASAATSDKIVQILAVLHAANGGSMTPDQVAKATGLGHDYVKTTLNRMARKGKIEKTAYGSYATPRRRAA